ncbi:monooxygenase FAD-binding [Calothrix sp. PCC 7716]|nr:monooxygenase FAD-binding [Calothrix sp. PCC 7716]
MSLDVLIVGAGPTGLLLAAQLARFGIKVRLVDQKPQPDHQSRAISVFARTLEIFDKLGVAEEMIKRGRQLQGINLYTDGKRIAHVSLDNIDSFFPFVLSLPQSETEKILTQLVESLGVKIERDVTFTALEQDNDSVTATLWHPDGEEEHCPCAWLVGCDGARSAVRKAASLVDKSNNIPALFLLADAKTHWQLEKNEFHVFFSSKGELAAFPLPQDNYWRVILDFPADTEAPSNPDVKFFEQQSRERTHLQASFNQPEWISSFRVRQRIVNKCRTGRVFVAGDALASHSPVGGQGMNTGLQDAYNLAWKLALVIQNQASTDLLHSYQAEREPISKSLLTFTELATRGVILSNPIIKQIRSYLASFLTSFGSVQQFIANTLSELNINYAHSPIVGEDKNFSLTSLIDSLRFRYGLKAGERAPDVMIETVNASKRLYQVLSDLKHNLLLFGGLDTKKENYTRFIQIAKEIEEQYPYIKVHLILWESQIPDILDWHQLILLDPKGKCHQRYRAFSECLYLIRPDFYIGYRYQGTDVSKLIMHLQKINFFSISNKTIPLEV